MVYVPVFDALRLVQMRSRGSALSLVGLAVTILAAGAVAATVEGSGDPMESAPTAASPSPVLQPSQGSAASGGPIGMSAMPIDVFTTRSGHWRLLALPTQADAAVYRMTLDEKPGFLREFACRPLFSKEAGKGTALDLLTVTLLGTEATVAQGACRVVQNMRPVEPRLEWIRQAVASNVIPAYRRERAWVPGMKLLARDPKRGDYDPKSLGPRPDKAAIPPTANHNFVGTTSAQGGEYEASRGFLHDADARVVDAALHSEEAAVSAYWPEFEQYSFYSLAQPQGAAWSTTAHVTIDPQFPQEGERGWEVPFYNRPNIKVDSATEVDGWGRNLAHLENTGFVHWLATEDPIAGFLVQRQAAYALAGRYEYLRGGHPGTAAPADTAYEGQTDEERAIFNTLSALWKSREVSKRVSSVSGRMFWSAARTERQADEVIAFFDTIAQRINAATPASPGDYVARLSGSLFGAVVGIGSFTQADDSVVKLQQTSAFQALQYGKEPLWLWTKNGNAKVRGWFTTYATGFSLRMAVIGGAMGVDGRTSNSGSGYPTGPAAMVKGYMAPAAPPYSSSAGWAEWVVALPLKQVDARDSFNRAQAHTAIQMEGALLMARDVGLPIPQLDPALSRLRTAKAATTAIRYPGIQMHKHLGAPF